MDINEIGEFGFIERIKPLFDGLVQKGQVGIGDDCAIIPFTNEEDLLVTTDLLIEDVHFLRNVISPEQLGYKALAVNLSDIAAMGGLPSGTFLSIAIPRGIDVEYLDSFMEGYHGLSSRYNTPLLGGDTTKSAGSLVINVTVVGRCGRGKAFRRDRAKVGDAVCVTGYLGDSAGGLQILLNKLVNSEDHQYLLKKHHEPVPRIEEGVFLSHESIVHSMIDISDGIASDLKHILKGSGVAARINLDCLPISEQLKSVASQQGWNVFELATGGGEDYELLFTVDPGSVETLKNEFLSRFKKPIFHIGDITGGTPAIKWLKGSAEVDILSTGFNHFK